MMPTHRPRRAVFVSAFAFPHQLCSRGVFGPVVADPPAAGGRRSSQWGKRAQPTVHRESWAQMKLELLMLGDVPVAQLCKRARLAEDCGFNAVWLADERFYREVYGALTAIALVTSRVAV